MDIFENDAFACYVMEQEGIFDCRSRQERLEAVIQELVTAGPVFANHDNVQAEIFARNHIDNLEQSEVDYIVTEVYFRTGGF